MERTKSFEFQGGRYQVSKLNALDGSNILRKFASSGVQDPQEFITSMPDEEFKKIQSVLLTAVSEIQVINDVEVNLPLILPSGVMVGKASEDAGFTLMLTIISLMFNISGFFVGSALKDYQAIADSINAQKP